MFALLVVLCGLAVVGCGGSGSSTSAVAAPANLVYGQAAITAVLGQAIAVDTPTVNGTVTSYSVSPALPAGLSLNVSTGAISGTPTVLSSATAYVVTAANGSGSTTQTVQITVQGPAPGSLSYLQPNAVGYVGQPLSPDTPSFTSTITAYSISPALPAGLTLDAASGVIRGTPVAVSAKATYTVTGSNAAGSTKSSLTVTVNPGATTLLDLGHTSSVYSTRSTNDDRLLSADTAGHWVLWNTTSGASVASGDGTASDYAINSKLNPHPIDMAGTTAVDALPNAFEVRSQVDGHLLSTIDVPGVNFTNNGGRWGLASDGSYLWTGTNLGLTVYSLTGSILYSESGDYSSAQGFGAPGTLSVWQGVAGKNVIETVSVTGGTSTVGAAFSGVFSSWFVDGGRFLTQLGSTVSVYSDKAVQQGVVNLPGTFQLVGQGNWVWTNDSSTLNVYAIGSATPSLTMSSGVNAVFGAVASGTAIGVFPLDLGSSLASPAKVSGPGALSVIDLSGAVPTRVDSVVPAVSLTSFTAISATRWIAGNTYGVLVDGPSSSGAVKYYGYGAAFSLAGSTSRIAVSTAIGQILLFDTNQLTQQPGIAFYSGHLGLSSDGTVLGTSINNGQYGDRTGFAETFYSLPSRSVISTFSSGSTDFALSLSGTVLRRGSQVTGLSGSPVLFNGNGGSIFLSPSGTSLAQVNGKTTQIFVNGLLTATLTGYGIGWINDNQVLVQVFSTDASGAYLGTGIYDLSGGLISLSPIPGSITAQTVNASSVYDSYSNRIYSLASGAIVWQGALPYVSQVGVNVLTGAEAGSKVVYPSGHILAVETY